MSDLRKRVTAAADAAKAQHDELAEAFAAVAATGAGRKVLGDIMSSLCDPDFQCAGITARGDAFLARYREASRIQSLITAGQGR